MIKNRYYNNILIIHTAFIGDVILITPLIRATKKLFPNANIDVIVIPQTKEILENNPNIRSIITFNKRENKFIEFFKILKVVKNNRYDLGISPHSSFTTALIMKLGKIKERIGFDRWISARLLTKKIEFKKNIHRIKKNLFLLSEFSAEKFEMQTELFPSEKMKEKASKILEEINKPIIGIAPGSVWQTKCWPKNYYKTLANNLVKEGYFLLFFGSNNEKKICEEIKPNSCTINLAGKMSILESAAVIEKCDKMVCNDSGALHIANAMKTDVYAFFGPTSKSFGYFPFRENDFVFEVELECRPCRIHGSKKCPDGHFNCMKKINPQYVLEKLKAESNY
jgi:heptosyltransferase-2